MMIMRELTGGLYFGERQTDDRERRADKAVDTLTYNEERNPPNRDQGV